MSKKNDQECKVSYQGTSGKLFSIWLSNAILTLATFGIYFFWARVRLKKYIYQNTFFDGKPFGYHATGKERFFGFLKGIVFSGIIFVVSFVISFFITDDVSLAIQIGSSFITIFVIALIPIFIVGSRRFDLSRTSWNQSRFYFGGKAKSLYKIYLIQGFLSIITLGIYGFLLLNNIYKFKIDNSQYGSEKFSFRGTGLKFLMIHIVSLFATIFTAGFFSFWYQAWVFKFQWGNISIQQKDILVDLDGAEIFFLKIKSFFILIFTLGLGFPIVKTMQLKLFTSCIRLSGKIDLKKIKIISDKKASATFQGIEEAGNLFG